MKITDTRVVLHDDDKLRAFVSITLDNSIVIRGLKVIRGNKGLFVAMPNRRRPDGSFQDIAHPIHPQARQWLERIVLDEYTRAVRRERGEAEESLDIDEDSAVQAPALSNPRAFDLPAN
jgi:stage V sporulation protein G